MSTAGRCPCVRKPQKQHAREKENIPSKPQQKSNPTVTKTTIDKTSKVVTKVVHPQAPVAKSSTGSVAKTTQNPSSATTTRSNNCCSRKPLTDIKDNQCKVTQSVSVKKRNSEPPRVQPKTESVRRNVLNTCPAVTSSKNKFIQSSSIISANVTAPARIVIPSVKCVSKGSSNALSTSTSSTITSIKPSSNSSSANSNTSKNSCTPAVKCVSKGSSNTSSTSTSSTITSIKPSSNSSSANTNTLKNSCTPSVKCVSKGSSNASSTITSIKPSSNSSSANTNTSKNSCTPSVKCVSKGSSKASSTSTSSTITSIKPSSNSSSANTNTSKNSCTPSVKCVSKGSSKASSTSTSSTITSIKPSSNSSSASTNTSKNSCTPSVKCVPRGPPNSSSTSTSSANKLIKPSSNCTSANTNNSTTPSVPRGVPNASSTSKSSNKPSSNYTSGSTNTSRNGTASSVKCVPKGPTTTSTSSSNALIKPSSKNTSRNVLTPSNTPRNGLSNASSTATSKTNNLIKPKLNLSPMSPISSRNLATPHIKTVSIGPPNASSTVKVTKPNDNITAIRPILQQTLDLSITRVPKKTLDFRPNLKEVLDLKPVLKDIGNNKPIIKVTSEVVLAPKTTSRNCTSSNVTMLNTANIRRGPSASSTLNANATWNHSAISFKQYCKETLIANQSSANNRSCGERTLLASNNSTICIGNQSSCSTTSVAHSGTFTPYSVFYQSLPNSISHQSNESRNASDTKSWETYNTIKSNFSSNRPYKSVKLYVPVYTANVNLQKGLLERSVYDGIPSLNNKTFMKQVYQPSYYAGVVDLDPNATKVRPGLLYATDIIHDIIFNIMEQQGKNILYYEFLDGNFQLSEYRASLVNWMIKLHHYVAPDTNVLFMAIRLFDKILATFCVQEIRYQIIVLTTFWISLKYYNSVNFITAPNLLKLCNNRYTLDYFLRTEQKILKVLNFDIAVDDPMIFVYYFIHIMQIQHSNIISYSCNYLLEIFALDNNINCFPLSLQAASVLYLSIKIFNYDDYYWQHVRKFFEHHDLEELYHIQRLIVEYLMLMDDENFPYRESYMKYASDKYDRVSLQISKQVKDF